MKALGQVVATLSHVPGVVVAMVVGAVDGLIIETTPLIGAGPGAPDTRKHTAALAAFL
jgi:predicted regulator of Ras-like GTPase activity (Roadblock/LC7/MglB family)